MRDNLRQAPVAPATAVRQRGHQRQVRARVLTATTAVVLITGGAGVAFAASHELHNRTVTPATTTSITTTTTSPTVSPTVTATVKPPAPTAVTPGGQATAPATPTSSATSHSTPPPAVPTTPVTTLPTTTSTTAPALPTAPAEYITVTATVLPGKGSFTWQSGASGMVAQTFDSATHKPIPGSEQFQSASVALDGRTVDGADGGDINCPAGSPIVHSVFSQRSVAPIAAKAGVHTLTVTVKSCDGVIGSKSVHFTVR